MNAARLLRKLALHVAEVLPVAGLHFDDAVLPAIGQFRSKFRGNFAARFE